MTADADCFGGCPQGCSNVLWGFSKVDLRHAQLLKPPGWPFLTLVKAMLQRSAELLPTDAAPVNYSMIMWSLGNISFHPGDEYMETFMDNMHLSGLLRNFDAQARPCLTAAVVQ